MRIVLDTNVLLAALFAAGLCEQLLDLILETEGATLVLSEHILDECREHAVRKFKVPATDMQSALALIRSAAEIVTPASLPKDACSDADDIPVLGTAIAGRAHALVTGDKDLLKLRVFRGIPILTPRDLFDRLA